MAVIPQPALERDENSNASRRKPRMYASFTAPTPSNPILLDFCVWLQTYFDDVIEVNESMRTCNHEWKKVFSMSDPLNDLVGCQRCGAVVRPVVKH